MVRLLRKLGMLGHRDGTAAGSQHHAHILQIQVAYQRLIMSFQRLKRPAIAVPGSGQQGRLHMLALDGAVKSAETINHGF